MKFHNAPLYGASIMTVGLITTYAVSVSLGHVYYWFPFISDTGAEPPESGIFGFTLNITSALLITCVYIRYCQVRCAQSTLASTMSSKWNQLSLVCGSLACVALNVVANFSELNMGRTHLSGAFMCFTTSTAYYLIQTKISYHFVNRKSDFAISKLLFMIRFGLCLTMVTFYCLTFWYGNLAVSEFTGEKLNYWLPEDGGFAYRLVATFSEWLTTLSIGAYVVTFTQEFRKLECDGLTVRIKE